MDIEKKIELQEARDFGDAQKIISRLFSTKLVEMLKRPSKSVSDCLFSGKTATILQAYSMEIKSVFSDYWKKEGSFLLKIAKYINLKKDRDDRNEDEKLLIIYLIPSERKYFIFNIDDIHLSTFRIDNMRIKAVEYDKESPRVETPCIFLPLEEAVCTGYY